MPNPGQEQFFNFIMERVRGEYKEPVKALLNENFQKQAAGTFTREDMQKTQQALMQMIKPEALEELKTATAHFAAQMKG